MPLRVGFDLDGVLCDFRSAFEQAADLIGVRVSDGEADAAASDPLSSRDIKRIWDRVRMTPNWWVGLSPHEPAEIARLYETVRRLKWEVVFLTRRPATAGDAVQFQSQWWLEQHGFFYPAVVTIPGSRGELANSARLDVVVDDQLINCIDVVGASTSKALLLLRDPDAATKEHALTRGIGVVSSLKEAIDILEDLHESLRERRGRLQRLTDWFGGGKKDDDTARLPTRPQRR